MLTNYPNSIQKLIDKFSKFPTVGPRTASRFVFHLLKKPKEEIEDLVKAILDIKKNIKICNFCFNPFEPEQKENTLCPICSDPNRDKTLLCVVEKESDLTSIEKTNKYKGLYFIFGGTFSNLKKDEFGKLEIEKLKQRILNPQLFGQSAEFKEIILAISPTPEGQATTLYLERSLKLLNKKISRLGRGLPVGGELEYADEETLSSALESRK